MIIDTHAHAFPPEVIARRDELLRTEPAFAKIYANADAKMATAQQVLDSMDEAGVDRTVVCNFAWQDAALIDETNEYLVNAGVLSKGRLLPFVALSMAGAGKHGGVDVEESVGRTVTDARSMVRQLAGGGARGIGELRPADSGYNLGNSDEGDLLMWAAQAYDLAILVHASEPVGHAYAGKEGGPIDEIYAFARAASGVNVIAAHWGGGLPFYMLMPEVKEALANVYYDTAATHLLYDDKIYHRVLSLVGPDRILFGSDFPLTTQVKALERVRDAGLNEGDLNAITGGNARELFGI
jgi:predicted TIM-barrel fold metal-dependent hydrolase